MLKLTKMLTVLAAVTALAISVPSAIAATYSWDGGGTDNEWFTDGNWDQADTPDTDDDVVIDIAGTVEHNSDGVTFNSEHLVITTVDQASSWWSDGPPRGGKSVTLSNADVGIEGSLFVGYGSVDGSSWTQSSGSLTVGNSFLIGGNDYGVVGSDGNGTVYMNGGSIEVTNRIHFADGTQLFEQTSGSVTGTAIDLNPPWHQPVNGSYDMTDGELTLTGTDMIIDGSESGTGWVFNFGGGDIYLGGDQSDIATTEPRFNITGNPLEYQAMYDGGTDTTHLFFAPSGLEWDGGADNWNSANWSGSQLPSANQDMIINAASADSDVTVAEDITTASGLGPASSVAVGADNASMLTIASGMTLEVAGDTTAGEFGKISTKNGAVLQTAAATIEADGRLITGVHGTTSGKVEASGQLTLEEDNNVQMDWIQDGVASMFGGTYTVAEYAGADAFTAGGKTTNLDGNIGEAYVASVTYNADLGGGVKGVEVTLHDQAVGDADLNGKIDGDDLGDILANWDSIGTDPTNNWFTGDFNMDGKIDGDDLGDVLAGWNPIGLFPPSGLEAQSVPEPGTALMLLIGMAGLLIYRKRR